MILFIFVLFFSQFDSNPIMHEGRIRPNATVTSEKPLLEQHALPLKLNPSIWEPIDSLKTKEDNFTLFNDEDFEMIRSAYTSGEIDNLSKLLIKAYEPLENQTFTLANQETIHFPSLIKLRLETFYTKMPWIGSILFCLFFSFVFLTFSLITKSKPFEQIGLFASVLGFLIQTLLLFLRVVILERPAVASMYETLLFVPWVAVSLSFILYYIYRKAPLLMTGNIIALTLLSILFLTDSKNHLEPIQPVLNSQLWLSIHVLMVVASYGIFAIGSIIGHAFFFIKKSKSIENIILQVLYTGVILLTAGTILGGVWAAQSWGRFWDWDPKEAWAFISISFYLVCIHLYRFNKISRDGLAFGAISGFLAISFCWYGVNYIIGTGMHSYGFGTGGSIYYLSFISFEILFLLFALTTMEKTKIVRRKIIKAKKRSYEAR